MRRRDLSDEELTTVINLKRAGTSWVKIQAETGINRRTAKRAYEKWERSQSLQELRDARKEVAAKAFLNHLKSLTTLAGSLVMNLSVPSSPDMMTRNAEQFFSELWQQDLLQRWTYIPSETREYYLMSQEHKRDMQFNFRENQLLFKCLQDHTRGEGVRWEALNQWSKARDNCVKVLDKLRKEPRLLVHNYFNLERQSNLLSRIKEEETSRPSHDPVDLMVGAVLNAIWQGILEDKLDQNLVLFVDRRNQGLVKVRNEIFLILNDISLAEKVTHICNLAVNNLRKGKMIESLQDGVRTMKDATEELREMLNPIKLTPMILRTRCDLCPA